MVLARQVPEPEWYPAGLFGACIGRSLKRNRSNLTGSAVITHDVTTGTGYCLVGFNWIIDFLN